MSNYDTLAPPRCKAFEQELAEQGARFVPLTGANEQTQNDSNAPHFGVALFNTQDMGSGGVAYSTRHGYRRFVSSGDLPIDTLWLSNLEQVDNSSPNLRSEKYLQSKLSNIAADLGVELSGFKRTDNVDKGGIVDVAKALTRVRDVLLAAYRWPTNRALWAEERMALSIRKALPQMELPTEELNMPLEGAFQPWSKPLHTPFVSFERGSRSLYFRRNRLQHAKDLMAMPMPAEGWMTLESGNLPIKAFLNTARPCLLQVSIEWRNATPEQISLIAFGSGVSRGAIRRWITQIELFWLVQYADITVERCYMANSAGPLPESVQLPRILLADPLFALSIPMGMVAEMHWNALTQKSHRPSNGGPGKYCRTPEGVWLRAMDRAISFQMAVAAQDLGAQVSGYGSGGVMVRVENLPIERLIEISDALDACHPCLAAEAVGRERGN